MQKTVIQQILAQYGLSHTVVLSTEKGYRNESHSLVLANGQKANLILYKSEPGMLQRIQHANSASNYLAARGFPARRTIDSRIIQLRAANSVKYGALYNYLPGRTIPWEAYTAMHIKLLGKTMSDMHAALRNMPLAVTTAPIAEEYLTITRRMQTYFKDEQVSGAIRAKLALQIDPFVIVKLRKLLAACRKLPNQQTLHMDFVRGNILFEANTTPTLSGILDFEKTAFGHPLFDIARTLAFLLVDCKHKPSEKVRKYFLYSGYTKRGSSTFRDIQISATETLLENLITLFLLYDLYKFLRHNPYEYLHQNEHFVRTRDLLAQQGVLAIRTQIPAAVTT